MAGLSSQRMRCIKVQRVATASILIALCIATNYALLYVPNVKLMDMLVFVSGFVFGVWTGVAVGAFSWLVYGTINPLGFSLPTLISTMIGETIYGVTGALLGYTWLRTESSEWKASLSIKNLGFGLVGLVTTLLYDLFTNAVTGIIFYNSVWLGLLTMNFPLPLGIIHEASNFLLFASICPLIIISIKRTLNGFNNK